MLAHYLETGGVAEEMGREGCIQNGPAQLFTSVWVRLNRPARPHPHPQLLLLTIIWDKKLFFLSLEGSAVSY